MSKDNSNEQSDNPSGEQPSKPQILLTFDSPDSINFTPEFNSVLPTQIMHAGQMLLMMGERNVNKVWTKQDMEQARKQAELAGIQQQIRASKN